MEPSQKDAATKPERSIDVECAISRNNVLKGIIAKTTTDIPFRYSQAVVLTQPSRAYFPYADWYRGEYMSDIPIIVEREAGFRPRIERPPQWKGTTGHAYPQHCFRPATNTKYPCYPECTEPYKRYDPTLQRASKIFLYS